MKRIKNDAVSFQKLDVSQMKKNKGGGYWATYTTRDGKTITIWVEH